MNKYPSKCYAFEPDGTIAWEHSELVVVFEDANGELAVGANPRQSLLLDSDGRVTRRNATRKPAANDWTSN